MDNDYCKLLPEISKMLDIDTYNYRIKYRNLYIKLIQKCKSFSSNDLSGYTEKHHILPRCLNGDDSNDNLIEMPVRYHIMAHILLYTAYPDNFKLAKAVQMMTSGLEPTQNSNRGEILNTKFSTKFLAVVREDAMKSMSGSNSPILGDKNPNKKAAISPNNVIYSTIKEAAKACNIPYMTLTKWISGESSDHGWRYYNCTKIDYNIIKRYVSQSSKEIIGPDGKKYCSIRKACEETSIPYTTMRYWISGRVKDNHGWSYVDPKNNKKKN